MNMRRRIELMVTFLALGAIGITALISYWLLMGKAASVEKELLLSNGHSITEIVNIELENLNKTNRDYAQWDDTLQYYQEGSEAYEAENFLPEVFDNLNVNSILFIDNEGDVVRGYSNIKTPAAVSLINAFDSKAFTAKYGNVIRENLKTDKDVEGFVVLEGRPSIISIVRISSSDKTVHDGAMAMVRVLGERTQTRIDNVMGGETAFEKPSAAADAMHVENDGSLNVVISGFITAGKNASAKLTFIDINAEPIISLKIANSNQIAVLSKQILNMIIIITFVAITGTTVLQSWLNNAFILAPIRNMGEFLNGIADDSKLREISDFRDHVLLKEDQTVIGRIHGLLRRISEDTVQLQKDRLSVRLALDSSMAGIWEYDRERHMIHGDAQVISLLDIGMSEPLLPRDSLMENVNPEHREALVKLFGDYRKNDGNGFQMECQIKNKAGEYRWFLIKGDGLEWARDGRCMLFSGILLDIEQKKRMESELVYLSYHDKLTGLYNRRYFEEHLEGFDKQENMPIAIFVADINGLKLANDAFGHERGDKLLKQAAECMEAAAGPDAVISRWGGDEYAILLPKTDEFKAEEVFKKIKEESRARSTHGLGLHLAVGYSVKRWGAISLQHVVRSAEEKMYRDKLLESRSAHSEFLEKFRAILNEKGIETYDHCHRVSSLGCAIGNRMNLNKSVLDEIILLGELHDIGKIGMPDEIFAKTGALTDLEWALVRSHPEIGFRIVALMQDYAHMAQAVLSHHEWVDGSGYPRGLKEHDIPLVARIISVADAVDVMLTGKPYKEKQIQEEVITELRRMQGIQFDPVVAEHMITILTEDTQVSALFDM